MKDEPRESGDLSVRLVWLSHPIIRYHVIP